MNMLKTCCPGDCTGSFLAPPRAARPTCITSQNSLGKVEACLGEGMAGAGRQNKLRNREARKSSYNPADGVGVGGQGLWAGLKRVPLALSGSLFTWRQADRRPGAGSMSPGPGFAK
jgi:hypothetical protein